MRILGIDPGTKCGYAIVDRSSIVSGVWDLSPRRHEGGGMRYLRLKRHLTEVLESGIDAVAYEEVRHHIGTDAAHVYGGIVAVISSECEAGIEPRPGAIVDAVMDGRNYIGFRPIPYRGIPVGTVKKFATGKGNADKASMMAAAALRWPNETMQDDNEADARFIALVLQRDLGQ